MSCCGFGRKAKKENDYEKAQDIISEQNMMAPESHPSNPIYVPRQTRQTSEDDPDAPIVPRRATLYYSQAFKQGFVSLSPITGEDGFFNLTTNEKWLTSFDANLKKPYYYKVQPTLHRPRTTTFSKPAEMPIIEPDTQESQDILYEEVARKLSLLEGAANAKSGNGYWSKMQNALTAFPLFKTSEQSKDKDVTGPILGSSLPNLHHASNQPVPQFVYDMIAFIEKDLSEEGLYRVGPAAAQDEKSLFEHIANGHSLTDGNFTSVDVAHYLKHFFVKMPVKLFTKDATNQFYIAEKASDFTLQVEIFKKGLTKMPKSHRETAKVLFNHFVKVVAHSNRNMMNSSNIAACFAPTLFDFEDVTQFKKYLASHQNFIIFMIENYTKIFT